MTKKILLFLATIVAFIGGIFLAGFKPVSAEIPGNKHVKEIVDKTEKTLLFKGQDENLYSIQNLDSEAKKELLKYNLKGEFKLLYQDANGNLIVNQNKKYFLLGKDNVKTEIENKNDREFIYFNSEKAFYKELNKLYVYDIQSKINKELNIENFSEILSVHENHLIVLTKTETTNVIKLINLLEEAETQTLINFDNTSKIKVQKEKFGSFIFENKEAQTKVYKIEKDGSQKDAILTDETNAELEDNFYFNGFYYVNGNVFKTLTSSLLTEKVTVLNIENDNEKFIAIKKTGETIEYYHNGQKLQLEKEIDVIQTRGFLVYKEKETDTLKRYNYLNNEQTEFKVEGKVLYQNDAFTVTLKETEIVVYKTENTEQKETLDISQIKKTNILTDLKDETVDKGKKLGEFIKKNWLYLLVGSFASFILVFVAVKLGQNRKRKR